MTRLGKILCCAVLIFSSGCESTQLTMNANSLNESKSTVVNEWQQGKIIFKNLEGGFYGLITDKQQKLLPVNLAISFQKNGLIVKFKGQELTDIMTIQQWGTPFKLSNIELIKAVTH